MLADLGRQWVNIYGQHEHQLLLEPERHLDLLDEYGELGGLRSRWEALWQTLGGVEAEIQAGERQRQEAEARRDLWEFQVQEIEAAGLQTGEEEGLDEERQRLIHAQRIRECLHRAEEDLYGAEGSALERLQGVVRALQEVARLDPRLGSVAEGLSDAALQIEDAVQQVRERARHAASDPQRLERVGERLDEIQRLKRKYRGEVGQILALAGELRGRLRELDQGKARMEGLLGRRETLRGELVALGRELREARGRIGEALGRGVVAELRDLGIGHPRFQVALTPLRDGMSVGDEGVKAGPRGLDRAEFLLSTNVGEALKPLSRIASGGELSRIMLALKKVLAEAGRVPTLIFDEIDSGIGGAVAHALGGKLALIATRHQVLCVTHLPQVACHAAHHLRVFKGVHRGRTVTDVAVLGQGDRVEEIARMLGGKVVTDRARAHARDLLRGTQGR
jgi:DNA repair protein RecN (Recombination protein N)